MIENVDINLIHHHPDNPRKDLGDLTELADSIRENGVLQNLTLVPWFSKITKQGADDPERQKEMGYYAVIGNRRLAAAKMAGLKELPCAISDMDYNTQIATMLLENMQRSDLTLYEQAQGFQMMIDLGENISKISEKTGFSETTVRRRVKLLDLDQEKLKKSMARDVRLTDYMELEKIESQELRNKVLETIGTENFNYELKKAIDAEEKQKRLQELVELLKPFAEETKQAIGMRWVRSFQTASHVQKPEDADSVNYYYKVETYGYVSLYKKLEEEDHETQEARAKEKMEREARFEALKETSQRSYDLRQDFAKGVTNSLAKKHMDEIIVSAIYSMTDRYNRMDSGDLIQLLGAKGLKQYELDQDRVSELIKEQPEKILFRAVYESLDPKLASYYNWQGKYAPNKDLDHTYHLLEKLGYEMSDEEKELREGTHHLFLEE